ncbi:MULTISPECIES: DUF924 family protein [unclassified Acinetobacter]|uniref:DUF924 family protein n=1 Tax=unclassified Acinetobacter TaxID=196816 RepID=UPI002935268E|nr:MULTISPECIES: DUF924 family protein [unclassified Acinetobacter]WOE30939.1 DUF924 family protein [Acinetobacter sp. SAAs470]WOE39135.1 DUF924 family protein [Acinetobacter sp. SAAs474]
MNYHTILDFWFQPQHQVFWFKQDDQFDQKIHDQFQQIHQQASQCELYHWRDNIAGRLAEIIVLDQFSRNLYRQSPHAFAQDGLALGLAQEAIRLGLDLDLNAQQRSFLYLPFMHSESKLIHQYALELFQSLANPINLAFEIKHKVIIDRFGRYPHRNKILGRQSSAEERIFLTQPDSHF